PHPRLGHVDDPARARDLVAGDRHDIAKLAARADVDRRVGEHEVPVGAVLALLFFGGDLLQRRPAEADTALHFPRRAGPRGRQTESSRRWGSGASFLRRRPPPAPPRRGRNGASLPAARAPARRRAPIAHRRAPGAAGGGWSAARRRRRWSRAILRRARRRRRRRARSVLPTAPAAG